jgi:hypothetical protein
MRRVSVYPGAIPQEQDVLNGQKNTMISIGHVLQDMLGTSTLFSGLGCVPTGPAGMTVNVNPGRAYSLQSTDTGAYSSLAADATPVMKQGILLSLVNFACPAPTTAGFSINYLIEGAFQEVDAGSTVLPYYNAANPAVAFSGPNGTGTSNTTFRDNTVQLQLKPGAAATTGSQVTPTPDAGFNGLWVVTVAFGATTITSGNITQFAGAPFLQAPVLAQTSGRYLGTQVITASGTYTPGTYGGVRAKTGKAKLLAGGGAGGSVSTTGAAAASVASGGNGGNYMEFVLDLTSVTTLAITIGAGGIPGAAGFNNGGNGGNSSVGALALASGGRGGNAGGPGSPVLLTPAPVANNTNSGSLTTTVTTLGWGGVAGVAATTGSLQGGKGGDSFAGTGGVGGTSGVGSPGAFNGVGGGGAGIGASATGQSGGSGGPGIFIVEEYS